MTGLVRHCPQCGQDNRSTNAFCTNCVASLSGVTPHPRAGAKGRVRTIAQGGYPLPPIRGLEQQGGGGGLVSLGVTCALAAFILQVGPDLARLLWGVAFLSLTGGFWQMRRDRAAFNRAGVLTVGAGVVVLAVVVSQTVDGDELLFWRTDSNPQVAVDIAESPDWVTATEETVRDAEPGPRNDLRMALGGPAHTGEQPGPGLVGNPRLTWNVSTAGEIISSPVMVDDVIYIGTKSGFLLALEAETGQERWRFDLGNYIVRSSPAVVDGIVYVTGGYDIYALDAESGQPRWRLPIMLAGPSSPTVVDGMLYVASQEGELYAVDAETGTMAWHYKAEGLVFSSPAVAGGMIYFASDTGDLYALEVGTGRLRWKTPDLGAIHGSPAVGDGAVFVSSLDGRLMAFEVDTGRERWRFTAGGRPTPAIVDGVVYAAAGETGLVALDAATGTPRWTFPTGAAITSSPSVVNDVIYAGSGASLFAINGDGSARWRFPTRDVISASPAIVSGMVLVASHDGNLYALGGTGEPPATG